MTAVAAEPPRAPSPEAIARARNAVAHVDRRLAQRDELRAILAEAIADAVSFLTSLREAGWRDDRVLTSLHAVEFRDAAAQVLRAAKALAAEST